MANLSIQSTTPSVLLNTPVQQAPKQAPVAPQTSKLAEATLDKVSLSSQAKSRGLNLREAGVAAGLAALPAAGLALMHDNKVAGIGYGLGLSAGAALAYMDFGNKTANTAKNIAAGAVIGGSLAGTVSQQLLVKVLLGERAKYAVAVGAVAGAGVAVYKSFTK